MKILFLNNSIWGLLNFRSKLITRMIKLGHDVIVMAPKDSEANLNKLLSHGCKYIQVPLKSTSTNLFSDFLFFLRISYHLFKVKPAVLFCFTIKPNIYGGIAGALFNIPVINNITGLGSVFVENTLLSKSVYFLYKVALKKSFKVFFQNKDDKDIFLKNGIITNDNFFVLPGSGVDLVKYNKTPFLHSPNISFIFIGRIIPEKGVLDYIEAARIIKLKISNARFSLLGFVDENRRNAITSKMISLWEKEGVIEYLGETSDVKPFIIQNDCVVLPSYYREGVPRVLLEASAIGRIIVTTNEVGCRDVVEDGFNGFICGSQNSNDLAQKLLKVVSLSHIEKNKMADFGRDKVEREFNEDIVITQYAIAVNDLLGSVY